VPDPPPELAPSGGYSLWVVNGERTSKVSLPADGRVVLGRSRSADVRIDHPSVSREHAALHLGPVPRVEDLRSANGTRLRGARLQPEAPVPLGPDDVLDVGAVLVVLRARSLSSQNERTCHPALFELHVEEREQQLGSGGSPFAVARIQLDGSLHAKAAELVIASSLDGRDVACSPAPGRYEVLFSGAGPAEARARLARVVQHLAQRGARERATLTCYPQDRPAVETPAARGKPAAGAAQGPMASDEAMTRVLRLLERIAKGTLSVILVGETGVGKDVCATYVHEMSARASGPLVRMNCAALPEPLVDAELFGHQRGAFTGAVSDRAGLLETASGGTVFLDEIGDMPLTIQVRLLRVLEAKEVTRVGATKPRPIDVRVIAATHHDLAELVTQGRFREDLYYRLNGISVVIPPLRERPLDIEPLARWFVARSAPDRRAPTLSPPSLARLQSHAWPGNVRELRNLMERAVALCEGPCIEPEHLFDEPVRALPSATERASAGSAPTPGLRQEVDSLERERILSALRACSGNQRATARLLGISRGALLRRLDRLGIA
jgi:DNA-binding NtrC family response regulator